MGRHQVAALPGITDAPTVRILREPTFWPLAAALLTSAAVAAAIAIVGPPIRGPAGLLAAPTPPAAVREPGDVCTRLLRPPEPGERRTFHPEYTQAAEAEGIAIVGTADVDPEAFRVAEETIRRVFAHNDLELALAEAGAYVIIVPAGRSVLDLPEFRCLRGDDAAFLEEVCGVADAAGDYPVATVEERDLLGVRSGPCRGLNILFHELGHLVDSWALSPEEHLEVRYLYADAMRAGLYEGEYASTNSNEYFAEGTQAFFASADPGGRRDRAWLRLYDPALYEFLARVYGEQ